MQYFTAFITALGLANAVPTYDLVVRQAIASVDRYAGPGCTGTICNIAGSGDLHAGCNAITDSCTASLKLNYAPTGCKVTIWTDSTCSSVGQFSNVTSFNCYALGPPIKSISVVC
ncbi:hypothetical protein BDV96DRAFT_502043 [Lophiotrema nucula]|uniref:Uncharacterized protein n=1 Tax=Lophiotrema nucula TaxID=690887 RepID=A0A6A5YTY6_9PLEO|nr:hypothetical protein BDV96DRAFT_502043 [Lophiotrema nucula]